MSDTLCFVGGGQMAASLIGGLLKAGTAAARIRVAEPNADRRAWLQEHLGVQVFADGPSACQGAETIVLAIKPQVMAAAVSDLELADTALVISIAAGIRSDSLRRWLSSPVTMVRTMPNTPALMGKGICGAWCEESTPDRYRQRAEAILRAVGDCVWVAQESDLDAVTAVSGSGPAYFFLVTEAMREAGVALGLEADVADRLAKATLVGAAAMVDAGSTDIAELRRNVTSPGGTTAAALNVMETQGLRQLFEQAMIAARDRGHELGEQLDQAS